MNLNLKRIKEKLKNKNVIISDVNDVFYLTRFKSSNLIVLLINEIWYAATDSRYLELAKKNIKGMKIIDSSKDGWIKSIIKNNSFTEIYLNESNTTISLFKSYKKLLSSKYGINVKSLNYGNIRDKYIVDDIQHLINSSKINDEIFSNIVSKIKIGMTEKKVESIILKEIIDSKADGPSFHPIVASGASGSNPHHLATNKVINKNEMLTIDMGVFYNGFASDMTRTFVVQGKISNEEQKIWNVVKSTMEHCIEMIKPGVSCKELHQYSINMINKKGYGKYFNHSLGHSLGIEVHESPNISIYSKDYLKEGMVITIEPGIYIPNKYGVRLEQTILVTKNGYKLLNKTKISIFL
ncbi:MAG: aminopeptidase P family protein [Mycoplasmataceae bacterium]|nr:aminopeptidase P family protein [Mycoplasmataceae bacterium]